MTESPAIATDELDRCFELLRKGLVRRLFRYASARARALGMELPELAELAQEVADEAFCRARRDLHRFDPERGPLVYWIFLLGRRQMARELNAVQRQVLARQAASLEWLEQECRKQPSLSRQVVERDGLRRALAQLPADQAQAMGLFYLLELSLEEVGEVMGRGANAVAGLLHRARANARERMLGRPGRTRGRPRKAPDRELQPEIGGWVR